MATTDASIHETEISSVTVMRSSAAERNKTAILEILKGLMPATGPLTALEIASGTGQHAMHLAEHMPQITWQPSECDKKSMQSIRGYIQVTQRSNVKEPLWIDVTDAPEKWANGSIEKESCDLMLCINMIHISEWAASEGLFKGAGLYLKSGGILATYGPYKMDGVISPESNLQFDQMLRQQNPDWGLRDNKELEKLANENGMVLEKTVDMPANNKTLVFRKS